MTPCCLYWECQNSNHFNKLYMLIFVAVNDNQQSCNTWYSMFTFSIILASWYSLQSCYSLCKKIVMCCCIILYKQSTNRWNMHIWNIPHEKMGHSRLLWLTFNRALYLAFIFSDNRSMSSLFVTQNCSFQNTIQLRVSLCFFPS